jgi:hypothetical protein
MDPNNNGNAGDVGENIPTPFVFTTLPIKFTGITASCINKKTVLVKWNVATPLVNAASFEIEYSADAMNWQTIGSQIVENINNSQYNFTHYNIPADKLFYRIKQMDNDGSYLYSNIAMINNKSTANGFVVYPNPAADMIQITGPATAIGEHATVTLFDAAGRKLMDAKITGAVTLLNVGHLPNGTYLLKMFTSQETSIEKIIIKH